MKYRKLGSSGLDVSLICLGTMTWGKQNTEDEGHAQMDYALDQGVNFFDTAEMYAVPPSAETYGATESIIGAWFTARKNRDKVVLASKIAGPGLGWVRNGQNKIDRKNILAAVEGSLKRLQTDYIDLYQLHYPIVVPIVSSATGIIARILTAPAPKIISSKFCKLSMN